MITEAESFNVDHPDLCHHLRWKGMLIQAEHDPTVQRSHAGSFWCVYTQTCFGPDGKLAEPIPCAATDRKCHGTGEA